MSDILYSEIYLLYKLRSVIERANRFSPHLYSSLNEMLVPEIVSKGDKTCDNTIGDKILKTLMYY